MHRELSATAQRKEDHLRIALDLAPHAAALGTGFDEIRLRHCALPQLNLDDIHTGTHFLGHRLRAPVLISGMTGGVERGGVINRRLARTAQALGCAMGVGSQRVALEDPAAARHFQVRDVAPDVFLIANLGAVQLNYGYGVAECQRAVEMIEASALALHLNPLQEALQAGGNTNWAGLLGRIEAVCAALDVPVIVKEVGWGISGPVARQLIDAGVAAIDTGGAGGTSWSEIERGRAPTERLSRLCGAFAAWGITTAESIAMVREVAPEIPLIASGGLRSGLDIAKAIALGANLVGIAAPMLRAAADSEDEAETLLSALIDELRVSMFCVGASTVDALGGAPVLRGNGQRSSS